MAFLFAQFKIIHYLCNAIRAIGLQTYYKKRLLALVLEFRNLVNFIHPRQEGNKRPLGYVYPARRASFGKLCLVAIHIRRGR